MAHGRTPRERPMSGGAFAASSAVYVAAYLAAAVWAIQFDLAGSALVWFPPAAVAVGAFFLIGHRLYPVAVVAEILSTAFVTGYGDRYGPIPIVVNALVLSAAYLTGAVVMQRLGLDPGLRRMRDPLVLVCGGFLVAPVLAAIGGGLVQVWVGLSTWSELPSTLGIFWVGDVVAIACLTPALLLIGSAVRYDEPLPFSDHDHGEGRHGLGSLLIAGEYVLPSLAAIALLAVGREPLQFLYLVFVPILAIAVRHGVQGVALSTVVLSATMTVGASQQATGALSASDFQALLGTVSFTAVMLGAIVTERRDLLEHHRRLGDIIEATPDLVASARHDGSVSYMNPVGRRLLGLGRDTPLDGRQAFEFFPDELAIGLMREAMRTADRNGTWEGENTLATADGRTVPVSQVLIRHTDHGQTTFSTVCRDVTDHRRLEDQLRRAALYDEATALPNRALLVEELGRALTAMGREVAVAVLFVDVDRFRVVNESLGYDAGDRVIATLAQRLQVAVPGQDLVARYAGGLFAIVMPNIEDEFEPIILADRVLEVVAQPIDLDHRELIVTASVGISLAGPGQNDALDALRAAEIALHRAKEGGGGRFALFDEAMERRSVDRLELESDLRQVLSQQQWWLAYQPIIDAGTRDIVSCEALLRWTHPVRGPVAPYQMIRLAEQLGLIVPLGREIFHRACDQAKRWQEAGFGVRVAINVSGRQLQEPGFVEDVHSVLEETGTDPHCIVIEVTETVLAEDLASEVDVLAALRALGCLIAIDDFGTGYSSLGGLRDLPIDVLKLDRSFITDLLVSARAAATVEAVITLAEALELTVVAEGVEEDDQLEALCSMGCDRIQGFAVSHPISADALTDLLQKQVDGISAR
jgi:diguanylate cyclase (GGDEF)-like protein/PAS domain S-box-containing protein